MSSHWLCALLTLSFVGMGMAQEAPAWDSVLSEMPLREPARFLNRTNGVRVVLNGFQSNATVKAIIFMPGATDELYFFKRIESALTNARPSLIDALRALTNTSPLRLRFHPPLLLIHSSEDVMDLDIRVEHDSTVAKIKKRQPGPLLRYDDRDWSVVQPDLRREIGVQLYPWPESDKARHFYRHSFVACGLTGWELLEAVAYAGKTRVTVRRGRVDLEPDLRYGPAPRLSPGVLR